MGGRAGLGGRGGNGLCGALVCAIRGVTCSRGYAGYKPYNDRQEQHKYFVAGSTIHRGSAQAIELPILIGEQVGHGGHRFHVERPINVGEEVAIHALPANLSVDSLRVNP